MSLAIKLAKESPRGMILIVATYADNHLEDLLRSFLREGNDTNDLLLAILTVACHGAHALRPVRAFPKRLAELVRTQSGSRTSAASVTRCLQGRVLTLELALHLFVLVELPPPTILPASLDETSALVAAREIAARTSRRPRVIRRRAP